jgi:hypothetical protein
VCVGRCFDGSEYGTRHSGGLQEAFRVVLVALAGEDVALHVGVDPTGVNGGDPQGRLFQAQCVSESAQGELAGRVRAPAGVGAQSGTGIDQYDVATGCPEGRKEDTSEFGDGDDVCLEGASPLIVRGFLDGSDIGHAGVVYQHVERRDGRGGDRDGVVVREVEG